MSSTLPVTECTAPEGKPDRGRGHAGRSLLDLVLFVSVCVGVVACAGSMDRPGSPDTEDGGGTDDPFGGGVDRGGRATDAGSTGADTMCVKTSFKLTESQVTFKVPAAARYMHIKAWGAGGNGEGLCSAGEDGGIGGFTEAAFKVQPGTPLIIIVGKRGRVGLTGEQKMRFGFGNWGGGGLSGVFSGSQPITEKDSQRALLIAGGGGSAGTAGCLPGGTGNHPGAGGQATMLGGAGVDGFNGGAGGYKGGTGGVKGMPSKGGTGYVAPAALSYLILYSQPGSAVAPRSGDPDYDGQAGKDEMNGRVVVHFLCQPPSIK